MILRDTFKLATDAIGKSFIIFKVFLKKNLKLRPHHQVLDFKIIFMLMLLLDYCFTEKQSYKKNLVRPISFNNFESVFLLLAKAVKF